MSWSDSEDEVYSSYSNGREAYQAYLDKGWSDDDSPNQRNYQNQYEDDVFNENDGGYDDEGYRNEDRFHAFGQQISYGGIFDQEEEQRNAYSQVYDCGLHDQGEVYQSPHWEEKNYSTHYGYTMREDDQPYEEVPYDQCSPSPQQRNLQEDTLALLTQMLEEQKETNKRLEQLKDDQEMLKSRVAQQALKIAYVVEVEEHQNEEVQEVLEDQHVEDSLEVLDRGFKEENDDENSRTMGYILSFLPTFQTNDELPSHLEESLEEGQDMERGLVIDENLVDNACEDLSRQFPIQQESIDYEEGIESWKPMSQIEDDDDGCSIKSWSGVEEPNLVAPSPSKFLSFLPFVELSYGRNSHDPPLANNSYQPRGSISTLDVHLKLGGRKWQWDIKVS